MEHALNALIVEDSEDDALLLVKHLEEGGHRVRWKRVDASESLVAALDEKVWDVIFADYTMPHFSGTEALDSVRKRGLDVPFIFVSGTIGEDTAVEAMRAGADDYIMKGNFRRLLPAVDRALRESRIREKQKRAEMEVKLLQSVMQVASKAGDVVEALSVTISEVCEVTPFVLAQTWLASEDDKIECSLAWYSRSSEHAEFWSASRELSLAPGEDIPGLAWASIEPVWIYDMTCDARCGRSRFARLAKLGAALAVPVTINNRVLAVLEFFLDEPREKDERLVSLISSVAIQLASVLQRKMAEERLNYLAHYDALTGLPNRLLFIDRLQQMLYDAERNQRLVGVAFLDLDRFKTINDSLGHSIGDVLLMIVGQRLESCLCAGDTVARLAGDEFALALPNLGTLDNAAHVAQKILDSFERPFDVQGHELYTNASLGVTFYPHDHSSVEGLLRNADIAMYRAKERGGNTYEFYTREMTAKAHRRLTLENDLRQALERDEFLLHYQPLMDLGSGQIVGAEALIRWNHPGRGLISPDEFIELAEETGTISRLGEWVLNEACAQPWLASCDDLDSPLRIAVNVSPMQFYEGGLARVVEQVLENTGFDPARLELEITETSLMSNAGHAIDVMNEVGALGVRFSVDDFGTGYSSLAYLKSLPIGHIKIDRSFVRDIPDDSCGMEIVSAVIAMAHNLGLTVIAEGVETHEQLEFLRAHGCDMAQGYYFSRPVPSDEFARLLRDNGPGKLTSG